jgi:hypothetical protein
MLIFARAFDDERHARKMVNRIGLLYKNAATQREDLFYVGLKLTLLVYTE